MLLIGLVAFVAPAAAEDKVAARAAFNEGTRHYDLAQYDEALTAFKRAYWSYEEPTFLFNIAQCQRALGHKEDALQMYRNYLRKLPEASNRAETQRLIVELEDAIARDKAARAAQPAPPPPAPLPAPSPDQARPAPMPAVVATAPRAKPPLWKRPWLWGVVGGVVAVGVGVGLGVGLGAQPSAPKPVDGMVTF